MAELRKKVTVQVPATSANCGPGFDCLGLACTLYNIFTYELVPAKEGVQGPDGRTGKHIPTPGPEQSGGPILLYPVEKLQQPDTGLKITCRIQVPVSGKRAFPPS